jgi:hypothetical protein
MCAMQSAQNKVMGKDREVLEGFSEGLSQR